MIKNMQKLLITVIAAFSFATGPINYGRDWRGTNVVCQDGAGLEFALLHHEPLNVFYLTQSGVMAGSNMHISYGIVGLSFTRNPLILGFKMSKNEFEQGLRYANLTILIKDVEHL